MSIVLNTTRTEYQFGKNRGLINYLLFMDDLKLYAKNVEKLDSLAQTVRVLSEDIGMRILIFLIKKPSKHWTKMKDTNT